MWNMDRGTGMRLRKVCPQCSTVIHARKSICECGHAFTLKREARNTASYHFGEPSLIPKLHTPALCIRIYYVYAVLLLISLLLHALINATCAGTRLYR